MIERIPEDLKAMPVWGVVATWSVDVLYDGLTYDEAVAKFHEELGRKDGMHCKLVLVVHQADGPPLPKVQLRPRKVY